MPKLIDTIVIAIGTFLAAVFLPKPVITFIRELAKFAFESLLKYWYLTILTVSIIVFINAVTANEYLGEYLSYRFILTLVISTLVVVSAVGILRFSLRKYEPINIALYGCFNIREGEYLSKDIDSEIADDKIFKVAEKISLSLFTYRTKLIKVNNVAIPRFVPIMLGHDGVNKYLRTKVSKRTHLATLHFIKDIRDKSLSVVINYDKESLTNTHPVFNAEKLLNDLGTSNIIHNSTLIEFSVQVYLLLFAQSLTDYLIDRNELTKAQYILDDTQKLIENIKGSVSNFDGASKAKVEVFLSFWLAYVERYKSILLVEQKQFIGAVYHIIKSIEINPYYPYDNYSTLKQDFTKKYGIQLAPEMNKMTKILDADVEEKMTDNVKHELVKQIMYADTTFNYEVIKGILEKSDSKDVGVLVLKELNKLDLSNPFILLTKSEVIKYIKKGEEKFNEMYVSRFDDCIDLLKNILEIDNDFPLINTKLGVMILMKGLHFENEKMIQNGIKEYQKGMHFITQLGFSQRAGD